jgi:AcrR family transcriptional regulator
MAGPAREGRGTGRTGGAGRRPQKLPSGRHGLLPSAVAANQRARILSAVTAAAAELGYAETSVEAVIARAGVSRRTFYEHFKNKQDAFLAAYDTAVGQQARQIRRAYLRQSGARERLRAGIRAYLQSLAGEPQAARLCTVEVLAAGPRALARRAAAMAMFAEIIEDNIHELIPACPRPALAAETIAGGIHEVAFSRILTGRTRELPALTDDLLTTILMHDTRPQDLTPGD